MNSERLPGLFITHIQVSVIRLYCWIPHKTLITSVCFQKDYEAVSGRVVNKTALNVLGQQKKPLMFSLRRKFMIMFFFCFLFLFVF